jgi:hypothetical protein
MFFRPDSEVAAAVNSTPCPNGTTASSSQAEEQVIFGDWEAVNIGPALWDLA